MKNSNFLAAFTLQKASVAHTNGKSIISIDHLGGKLNAKGKTGEWRVMPLMKLANEELSKKLDQIQAYYELWGSPYPKAHLKDLSTEKSK